jgi:nicotinamide-nucleotide amidase
MQLLDVPECLLLQHGAVSAEAAVAMATGAAERLGAEYALAITGFAGPCGGTQENPVGTIFIALHAPQGVWSRKLSYPGPRTTVKVRAVNAALDWLRRELVRAAKSAHVAADSHGVMQ